jgi:hypothetical protein
MTDPAFAWPTPITAAVTVQGQPLADGSVPDANPTVLSGLRLTWGRGTTVDQPDTATAVFTVEDTSGDQAFARTLAVGRLVDITATGTTWADDTVGTFTDPTFDSWPAGPVSHPDAGQPGDLVLDYRGATVAEAHGAGKWIRTAAVWAPVTGGITLGATILPAPLAAKSDPTAWDHIPATVAGQTWRQRIGSGWKAPGAVLRVAVARFANPWTVNPALDWPAGTPAWDPSAGPWIRDYSPAKAGEWQATYITANPVGYAWNTVPPALTWAATDPSWTWQTMAGFAVDDVDILAPAGSAARTVRVFSGRITDSQAEWDTGVGAAMIAVTAADITAELSNRDVGDEPWPAETLAARARRILSAAGRSDVTLYADPRPGGITVTRMDVDRQQVFPMLADLATSVDAVLWAATHATTGPYLWVEDMQHRTSVQTLALVGGVVVIVTASAGGGLTISACDVDLDPVRWIQTNADLATRCVVDWQDQTGDPDPVQRTAQVVITDAEKPAGPYGVRRVQVTSQVTTEADATTVATGVVQRLFASAAWRVSGLTTHVEDDADTEHVTTALALLDGTTRIGAPIWLTDLPDWSPAPSDTIAGYLEGGTYQMTDGAWTLELVLSAGAGVGASYAWQELDHAWTWAQFDHAIRWLDLVGVGPDTGGTRP